MAKDAEHFSQKYLLAINVSSCCCRMTAIIIIYWIGANHISSFSIVYYFNVFCFEQAASQPGAGLGRREVGEANWKEKARRLSPIFLTPTREPLKTSSFLLPPAIVWNINTDLYFKCSITSYDAAFSVFRRRYLGETSRSLGWWEWAFEGGTRTLWVPLLSVPVPWDYSLLFDAVTMLPSNNGQKYPWNNEPK